ncbi:MAG: DUF1189 domain-containing protein [Streptococcaceae bacterium]|jgi:hypothetical protein|nr:DUF1189 domain-containing protein [Streptococcaceae bacterium]
MTEIFNLIKYSFTDLPKLVQARFLSWNKTIVYFLFLTFILAVPITTDIWTYSDELISDAQKISNQLPAFKVANGEITQTIEPSIYQTNHFIVTLDPKNKRKFSEINTDASGDATAIVFRKQELRIVLPNNNLTNEFETPRHFKFSYQALGNFSSQSIKQALIKLHKPLWLFIVTYLISLLPSLQNLLFLVLTIAIIVKLFSLFSKNAQLSFAEIFKAVLVCSTPAIVLTTLLSFIFPTLDFYFIQTVMTYILYYHIFKKVNLS